MRGEVIAHAALEGLGAEVALEHVEDAGALLVRDAIERSEDVVLGDDRLTDLARADQAVALERGVAAGELALVLVPRRIEARDDLPAHPAREALVEPDVVPVRHRHQVAEPLVRELVRRDRDPAQPALVRGLAVHQHQGLGVSDEAGVLHRAKPDGERDREHVHLVVRVRRGEVVLEQIDDPGRRLGRVRRVGGAVSERDDADRRAALGLAGVDDLERPDAERDQVRRQRPGLRKLDALLVALERGLAGDRRVRHRDQRPGHVERQLPRHLVVRLVEARECAARKDRLELGVDVGRVPHGLLERAAGVERVERAGVVDRERPRARLERLGGAELEEVVALGGRGQQDVGLARAPRDRRVDRELPRVEPDHQRALAEIAGDLDRALEARARRIDLEPRRVAGRREVARQAQGRLRRDQRARRRRARHRLGLDARRRYRGRRLRRSTTDEHGESDEPALHAAQLTHAIVVQVAFSRPEPATPGSSRGVPPDAPSRRDSGRPGSSVES